MSTEFVAAIQANDFQREASTGEDPVFNLKGCPTTTQRALRGLLFPKLTAGNLLALGYLAVFKIPANLTMGTGLTFKFNFTDDGTFASDLGLAAVIGITVKTITSGTSNTDPSTQSPGTEQVVTCTLNATSGVLVTASLAIASANLNSAAVGSFVEICMRRKGTAAADTAQGAIIVVPPLDVSNT